MPIRKEPGSMRIEPGFVFHITQAHHACMTPQTMQPQQLLINCKYNSARFTTKIKPHHNRIWATS